MNEEKVLRHPKKLVYKRTNIQLLIKFKATKIPKKNDAMKLIIEVF